MTENIMGISQDWAKSGEGSYEYYVDNAGKRVKNGKYYFINSTEKAIPKGSSNALKYIQSLMVKGQFVDGKKEGLWEVNYDFGSYRINYHNDQLNGVFTITSRLDPTVNVVCHFRDNHFVGDYKCIGYDWLINGQFDDNGFADGTWSLVKKEKYPYTFYYVFANGMYVNSYMYDDSTGEQSELREGNSSVIYHDQSVFGPGSLLDYDVVFYIRDYLSNGAFDYALPPFIYKESRNGARVRSRNHNSFNIIEYEARVAKEDQEREAREKQQQEEWILEREHPYVVYNGNIAEDILNEVRSKLPKVSPLKALGGYEGRIWIYLEMDKNGNITATANNTSKWDRVKLIVDETIKAAEGLSGSPKITPGYRGRNYRFQIHYYPGGKIEAEQLQ